MCQRRCLAARLRDSAGCAGGTTAYSVWAVSFQLSDPTAPVGASQDAARCSMGTRSSPRTRLRPPVGVTERAVTTGGLLEQMWWRRPRRAHMGRDARRSILRLRFEPAAQRSVRRGPSWRVRRLGACFAMDPSILAARLIRCEKGTGRGGPRPGVGAFMHAQSVRREIFDGSRGLQHGPRRTAPFVQRSLCSAVETIARTVGECV